MDVPNSMPRVSVIMPLYNAESYVAQAIETVKAQTMTDWELLVIDDCATDGSHGVAVGAARNDARIRILRNDKNIGVARTRNRGIELARGEYIAFLDSDDFWEPQMLEKMLERMSETDADIVYCSYAMVDEQGNKVCNDFIVPPKTEFKDSIVRSVITCSTVLLKKEIVENNHFPTNIYHEDIALWFRLLMCGARAYGVTEVLASYRQRHGSRSSGKLISAFRRWPIYRKVLGMSVTESATYMLGYAYYGIIKYKKIV